MPTPEQLVKRLQPLKQLERSAERLLVNECYTCIQGEGAEAGRPAFLVRLSVCNLRCGYCDSAHSFAGGELVELEALAERVAEAGHKEVLLTGGEPLLQPGAVPFMNLLIKRGHTVFLETSGSVDISQVPHTVNVVLDIKTPGSGEVDANLWENLKGLGWKTQVKFVVCDRADFDWALEVIAEYHLSKAREVLISPSWGDIEPADVAGWIMETRQPILRLNLQQHKYVWPDKDRGV